MRAWLHVAGMPATLILSSVGLASNRDEADLTCEPSKPPEPECEPADRSDPNHDPVYRPRMKRPPGFCGRDLSDMERYRCEAVISFQFGEWRRVAESYVELRSGGASCKQTLELWIPEWQLCPDAADTDYSGKMQVVLCDPRMMPDKPSKPVEPESPDRPSEPSPILGGVDMLLKQVMPRYDRVFDSNCGGKGKSSADGKRDNLWLLHRASMTGAAKMAPLSRASMMSHRAVHDRVTRGWA